MRHRVACLVVLAGWAAASGCGDGSGTTTSIPGPSPARLELRAPPSALVKACRKFAAATELSVVYCPPAIPRGTLTIDSAGPFGTGEKNTYFINALSPSLPHPWVRRAREEGRSYPPPGHWVVAAWRPASDLRSFLGSERARPVGSELVQRVKATVLLAPAGAAAEDAGHAIVLWRRHGVGYTASVHGHVNEPVARAMARALILEMVRCSGSGVSEHSCRLAMAASTRR
jgi:hypothetical protein